MRYLDVFNGDADGLCALQQLRLAQPLDSELVTGTKRDIHLLDRVTASNGDHLTVLDISAESNRADLGRILGEGATVEYFDHHACGILPEHRNFHPHIDLSADTCTSLLVNKFLDGAHYRWAITGAYGDNLQHVADKLAEKNSLDEQARLILCSLGVCLNYNGYGDALEDLFFHPAELYRQLAPYADPLEFASESLAFIKLRDGYQADMIEVRAVKPEVEEKCVAVYILPDTPWSRRVTGVFANMLANAAPARAHAVLTPNHSGSFTVSVRAPKENPTGASALCKQFPNGGGREAAAGINFFPPQRVDDLTAALRQTYSA